jgi:hypothetical protein
MLVVLKRATDTADYNVSDGAPITMGVGEYHTPWQAGSTSWKRAAPKQYGATLRLETNPELYEGLRYASPLHNLPCACD